jgi:D-apionate oxidoisomerase
METVALFGAAGKIGTRIANSLRNTTDYRMLYVESGEVGMGRLRERGLTPTTPEEAVPEAGVVILAIPDVLIGKVAAELIPTLNSGTLVILLDPAAPHGGELPDRKDISYFLVHPCHPPIVCDEDSSEARMDFWGGKARQNIVCALMQGTESDYLKGERIARRAFAPVMNSYRVTVEQMAILEPALAETVVLTCQFVINEAIDEAARRGVPYQIARDFVLGHMKVNVGILFGYIDAQLSDGAKLAVARAKENIFQPDWKKVFEPENVLNEVKAITRGRAAK